MSSTRGRKKLYDSNRKAITSSSSSSNSIGSTAASRCVLLELEEIKRFRRVRTESDRLTAAASSHTSSLRSPSLLSTPESYATETTIRRQQERKSLIKALLRSTNGEVKKCHIINNNNNKPATFFTFDDDSESNNQMKKKEQPPRVRLKNDDDSESNNQIKEKQQPPRVRLKNSRYKETIKSSIIERHTDSTKTPIGTITAVVAENPSVGNTTKNNNCDNNNEFTTTTKAKRKQEKDDEDDDEEKIIIQNNDKIHDDFFTSTFDSFVSFFSENWTKEERKENNASSSGTIQQPNYNKEGSEELATTTTTTANKNNNDDTVVVTSVHQQQQIANDEDTEREEFTILENSNNETLKDLHPILALESSEEENFLLSYLLYQEEREQEQELLMKQQQQQQQFDNPNSEQTSSLESNYCKQKNESSSTNIDTSPNPISWRKEMEEMILHRSHSSTTNFKSSEHVLYYMEGVLEKRDYQLIRREEDYHQYQLKNDKLEKKLQQTQNAMVRIVDRLPNLKSHVAQAHANEDFLRLHTKQLLHIREERMSDLQDQIRFIKTVKIMELQKAITSVQQQQSQMELQKAIASLQQQSEGHKSTTPVAVHPKNDETRKQKRTTKSKATITNKQQLHYNNHSTISILREEDLISEGTKEK